MSKTVLKCSEVMLFFDFVIRLRRITQTPSLPPLDELQQQPESGKGGAGYYKCGCMAASTYANVASLHFNHSIGKQIFNGKLMFH